MSWIDWSQLHQHSTEASQSSKFDYIALPKVANMQAGESHEGRWWVKGTIEQIEAAKEGGDVWNSSQAKDP